MATAALDLAAGFEAVRLLRHAPVQARDDLVRQRRRWRLDHVREHDARTARSGVARRIVEGLADWEREMPEHYATARRMLGVTRIASSATPIRC